MASTPLGRNSSRDSAGFRISSTALAWSSNPIRWLGASGDQALFLPRFPPPPPHPRDQIEALEFIDRGPQIGEERLRCRGSPLVVDHIEFIQQQDQVAATQSRKYTRKEDGPKRLSILLHFLQADRSHC